MSGITLFSTALCFVAVFGPVLFVPWLSTKRFSKVPPRVDPKIVRWIFIAILVGSWLGTGLLTYLGHYPRMDLVLRHF